MVNWTGDGSISGYRPESTQLYDEQYLLVGPAGTADVNGPTRLQYAVDLDDRITAKATLTFVEADAAYHGYSKDFGLALVMAKATLFPAGKVPTPAEIMAQKANLRVWRSTRVINLNQAYTLTVQGPRSTDLEPNTKYWFLLLPAAWDRGSTPSGTQDKPAQGDGNAIGRALSLWTNRTPAAPVITSPVSGTVAPAGTDVNFTFQPKDPDAVFGADNYSYDDISGIQVQYAPRATAKNPAPVWQDLPFAAKYGPLVAGGGWYIDGAAAVEGANFDRNSGVQQFWATFATKIRCGANNMTAGYAILPSGEWQIRMRTFDYGHPYPGTRKAFARTDGSQHPDTAPATNTSPWSEAVTITISSQVPTPVPLAPVNDNAVMAGQPLTLVWQYRNTANPPYPQASRKIEMRKVGEVNWTQVVSGNGAQPTFIVPDTYPRTTGEHYEWRVQVTDSNGVTSNWSEPARFWVVPATASGPERPLPTDTIDGATLGCGTNTAVIYRRGGKERVGVLGQVSYLDWGRVRDDISSASITISGWDIDCGNLLARLQCWAYEVVIFRDNGYGVERVWEGPITLLRYEVDKVTIQAKDVIGYAYRRIIKQSINDRGDTVVNRAARVIQNAFAPDDPNVLGYLTVMGRDDDAKQYRSLPPYSRTAFEEIDDMAANSGLDYCAVGRSILIWGTKHRIGTLPEFRDKDLGAPPIVTEYGMAMANRYAVSDGNGVYGEATRLDADGKDETYGLVEMLSSTWASDSDAEADTYTEEGIATVRKSFADYAERSIADRYPPPVTVRVPDGTTLNPDTVLNIQQLVPGVVIPLRSMGTLREVHTSQKLDSMKVVETKGKETITVTMSAFSRDDASTEETGE